jgi:pantoate kinase
MLSTGRSQAFSPGHITGFFHICDQSHDPLKKGSLGAGFSLVHGVTTRVEGIGGAAGCSARTGQQAGIFINGQKAQEATVSELVLKLFFAKIKQKSLPLKVEHSVDIPIGAGFGSSGAAALSLAYALNSLFNSPLSQLEAAQLAHQAEVKCHTGLGTVIAESVGGLEIRKQAGAPGIGEIIIIPVPDKTVVLCLVFGSLSTKQALTDKRIRKRINLFGKQLVAELLANPCLEVFLTCSRRFAEHTGLITERVAKVMKILDSSRIPCSMPIFGEGLFTMIPEKDVPSVFKIIEGYKTQAAIIKSQIDPKGGRVIHAS